MVFGVSGCCRRKELTELTLDNITQLDDKLLVTIPYTKTYVERSFVIVGGFYSIIKKYLSLRSATITTKRLFITKRAGKFINIPVGINSVGGVPKAIALYLNLPDPQNYTSHCFRRTSATIYADSGATEAELMRFGKWKSSTVARGYVEDSVANKTNVGNQIHTAIMPAIRSDPTVNIEPELMSCVPIIDSTRPNGSVTSPLLTGCQSTALSVQPLSSSRPLILVPPVTCSLSEAISVGSSSSNTAVTYVNSVAPISTSSLVHAPGNNSNFSCEETPSTFEVTMVGTPNIIEAVESEIPSNSFENSANFNGILEDDTESSHGVTKSIPTVKSSKQQVKSHNSSSRTSSNHSGFHCSAYSHSNSQSRYHRFSSPYTYSKTAKYSGFTSSSCEISDDESIPKCSNRRTYSKSHKWYTDLSQKNCSSFSENYQKFQEANKSSEFTVGNSSFCFYNCQVTMNLSNSKV